MKRTYNYPLPNEHNAWLHLNMYFQCPQVCICLITYQWNVSIQHKGTIIKTTTNHTEETRWHYCVQYQLIHWQQNSCPRNQGSKSRVEGIISMIDKGTRSFLRFLFPKNGQKTTSMKSQPYDHLKKTWTRINTNRVKMASQLCTKHQPTWMVKMAEKSLPKVRGTKLVIQYELVSPATI